MAWSAGKSRCRTERACPRLCTPPFIAAPAVTLSTTSRSRSVATLAMGFRSTFRSLLGGVVQRGELLDTNGGRLELGRARFRIDGVDREDVRVDLVGEMQRHEGEPRPETAVDAHGRDDG